MYQIKRILDQMQLRVLFFKNFNFNLLMNSEEFRLVLLIYCHSIVYLVFKS